jgi:precorrin-6B methylase 2
MGVRAVLSKVAPEWATDRHQRWRERRLLRRAGRVGRMFRERHDSVVRHGPFAGLRYPDDLIQVPKLLGTYELELHAAVERLIARDPRTIVNVGAGEGYYAVGLARRLPRARVLAFDIDAAAQRQCLGLAELNGVEDRVTVSGECVPALLADLPRSDVALIVDCEGCELGLLRPDEVPSLRDWTILVELHDFIDPDTSDIIVERFAQTHHVELIEAQSRRGLPVEELTFLAPRKRAVALGEARPPGMRWAEMRPQSSSRSGGLNPA